MNDTFSPAFLKGYAACLHDMGLSLTHPAERVGLDSRTVARW